MKQKLFYLFVSLLIPAVVHADGIIRFADPNVEAICLENWDTNHDGELSKQEAAAVTSLNYAFNNKDITSFNELQYFTSLTSIAIREFYECSSMTSLTIPDNVETINNYAFYGCTNLTSVIIGNSVKTIGDYAFQNCKRLTSVTIPNSVKTIGQWAFYNCSGLISVTIGNSVTSIESSAFHGCGGLTSVTIPNSVKTIGQWAFSDCSGLISVTIPNSVTSIGERAFQDCRSLTSLAIPQSVTSIGYNAFEGTYKLASIIVDTSNPKYDSRNDCNAVIESSTNTLIVGCMKTTIPNSVTSIGDGAFDFCLGLTSIIIPENVKSIGNSAFCGCRSLISVSIPNSVKNIGDNAFADCRNLSSITIPDGVTCIRRKTFYECNNLTSVTIPSSVTSIEEEAFWMHKEASLYISDLTAWCNITFGPNFFDIKHLYINGQEINSLIIPDDVTSIHQYNFRGFSCLTSVTIPNSVTSIGESAFAGCKGLTSIAIPNSVTSIGERAFQSCGSLISVIIPSSTTSIERATFYGCEKLTQIIIPNNITTIGQFAFQECRNLTSITIPKSVTAIGNGALYECSSLTSVRVERAEPIAVTQSFVYRENTTLYVPKGSKAAYEAAEYWKEFKEIVEYGDAQPDNITFADAKVKAICVANWDTDHDGELSKQEAAAVTSIGTVFSENWEITRFDELQYFTGLTAIDDNAFAGCDGLTSITLPNTVTSLGTYAFSGCDGLTSFVIPTSVTTLNDAVFNYCASLTSIIIPKSVTRMGFNPLNGCSALTSIQVESGNANFDSCNGCNAIIYGKSGILVSGCKNTVIPDGIKTIWQYAFGGCEELTSITIPASVTTFGDYAFFGCDNLEEIHSEIVQPSAINATVFGNTDIFTTATLYVPAGTKAQYQATDGWKDFRNIVEQGGTATDIIEFADAAVKAICVANWDTDHDGELSKREAAAVTSIGTVFKYNLSITKFDELKYFTGLTSIDIGTFQTCSGLTSLTIPSSVTSIDEWAFHGCSDLTSLAIPNSVTSIGTEAFMICGSLTTLMIPSSVTSIGEGAFAYSGLTSIIVEDGNTVYDSRNNCNAIIKTSDNTLIAGCKNTVIPSSVTSIGNSAFEYCSGLTSMTIPSSVTSIGKYAFYKCFDLTSVTIPNSVTSIGTDAFDGCSGLASVTVSWDAPLSINTNVFKDINYNNVTLYVPYGTKAAYQAAAGWSNFQNIVEDMSDFVSLVAKSYTRVYGEENPVFEYEVTEGTPLGTPTLLCDATKESSVGEYVIAINTSALRNSVVEAITGTLIITKAQLVVTAQSIMREYGEENPGFTCKISGFMNEDTVLDLTKLPVITTTATSMSSAGTYDIIVSGGEAQNYEFNYVAGTLTIVPKDIAAATVTVADSCAYTGFSVCPDVTVVLNGQVLTERTDYILTLSENIRTGVASLTITGAGNYTGSVTKTFVIFNPQPTVDDLLPDEGDNNGASDYSSGESGVNESTDLNEKVVGNVYYCITPDAGGYDAEEGCLVINKAATTVSTELPAVDGQLPSVSNGFRGLVFFVNAGRGKVKIKAETTGNLLLCVKIAGELVMSMAVEGKTTLTIPYDVSQPSEVLVYAGFAAGSRGTAPSTTEDALKIYSLEWESEPTAIGVDKIENGKLKIENYYDLNGRKVNGQLKKGVYIVGGRKRVVK